VGLFGLPDGTAARGSVKPPAVPTSETEDVVLRQLPKPL
jgi:hypothetical protein